MLQLPSRNTSPDTTSATSVSFDLGRFVELYEWCRSFLRRQYPIVIATVGICLSVGLIYLFTTPPKFTAMATIVLDTRKVQIFQQQPIFNDQVLDSSAVDTQVEVLRSDNLARAVVKDLRLSEDPDFTNPRGNIFSAAIGLINGLFSSEEPPTQEDLINAAAGTLSTNLKITRIPLTYAIQIEYRSLNPQRAAQVANGVADAYLVDSLEAKYQANRRTASWLQDRLKELREQASSAQEDVIKFKSANNIVDTGGRLINDQQLVEMNSQLSQAKGQTSDAKARLDRVQDIIKQEIPDATVTDTLKNDVISKLRSQYLELSSREAIWAARYGPDHLATVNLRTQMMEIRRSILDELKRIAEGYKSDYQIAKDREQSLEAELEKTVASRQDTNQAQVQLRELDSKAQTYQALYDNFMQRYMESVQQQSFPVAEARVITTATPPDTKSSPKTLLILGLASLGGIFLGLGFGFARELSDRVVRTADQLESAIDADCLAIVPLAKLGMARDQDEKSKNPTRQRSRTIVRERNIFWNVVDDPFSRFAEAIRSIRLGIDLQKTGAGVVVGFTSSMPGEGKSTIAMSLAQLLAQSGARVIAIDADIRNPTLTRALAPTANVGLVELLGRKAAIPDILWKDPSTDLDFLPTVSMSRTANSSDLLSSESMKSTIELLRKSYEYVIVDFSPLMPVIDVRTTFSFVDGYIFVAEWGRTKAETIKQALKGAPEIQSKICGGILNKVNVAKLGRFEKHGQDYYYNRAYARYGYGE